MVNTEADDNPTITLSNRDHVTHDPVTIGVGADVILVYSGHWIYVRIQTGVGDDSLLVRYKPNTFWVVKAPAVVERESETGSTYTFYWEPIKYPLNR